MPNVRITDLPLDVLEIVLEKVTSQSLAWGTREHLRATCTQFANELPVWIIDAEAGVTRKEYSTFIGNHTQKISKGRLEAVQERWHTEDLSIYV